MKIQPIVEGHGEVTAVPILLRRLIHESGAYQMDVGKPIRSNRTNLVHEDSLRKAVRLALLQPECSAILVLFDGDDDCPKELAPTLQEWASDEAGSVPCAVVIAQREFEAWFLAAMDSLKGKHGIREDAAPHLDPESPRGAKEALEEQMELGSGYSETVDQAPLTALFDFNAAYKGCRSFRRMVKAFGSLLTGVGLNSPKWAPDRWILSK